MARQLTPMVSEVLTTLAAGPVEHAGGRAVAALFEKTKGYRSVQSLSITVSRLETQGLLARHTKGTSEAVRHRWAYGISITDAGLRALGRPVPRRVDVPVAAFPPGPASTWGTAPPIIETPPGTAGTAGTAGTGETAAEVGPAVVRDGVDYEVLAGVLLKRVARVLQTEGSGESLSQLKKELFDAQQAENAAKRLHAGAQGALRSLEAAVAAAKGRILDLQGELAVMKQNNEVLTEKLDVHERRQKSGFKVKEMLSNDDLGTLSDFQRELARVMVQPPVSRG